MCSSATSLAPASDALLRLVGREMIAPYADGDEVCPQRALRCPQSQLGRKVISCYSMVRRTLTVRQKWRLPAILLMSGKGFREMKQVILKSETCL